MGFSRLKLFLRGRYSAVLPQNTVAPSISGIPTQGQTLTLNYGEWTGTISDFLVQWLRDGVEIVDATDPDYLLTSADVGAQISGEVTAVGPAGEASATSASVGPVASSSPILPASQTVPFGVKTRVGCGGHKMGYTGSGYLGITAGNASLHWQINSLNELVPKTGTAGQPLGTSPNIYKSAPPTFAGPYALTITEYSDPGKTTPTGVTGTVNITITPTAADAALMPIAAAGCTADNLSTRSYQLADLIQSATIMTGGDTIYCRDGYFNSESSGSARIRPPASGWTTSGGKLTVRSRTVDASVDANGNPNRRHGFKIGRLSMAHEASGNIYWPLDFRDVFFHVTVPWTTPAIASGALLKYSDMFGYGVSLYNSRMEADENPNGGIDGIVLVSGPLAGQEAHLEGVTFVNGGKTILVSCPETYISVHPILKAIDTFDQKDDVCAIGLTNATNTGVSNVEIEGIFTFGGTPVTGSHPDFIQHQGVRDGLTATFGSVKKCALVMANEAAMQAYFYDDTTSVSTLTDCVTQNCIATTDRPQGVWLTRISNADIRFNTILKALNGDIGGTPAISIPATSGAVNGTYSHNVCVALSVNAQTGTVVKTPNAILATNQTAYETAFPYYTEGPELVNKQRMLRCFTPANTLVASGGVMNPDGTANGALFPLNDPGDNHGAWNDGTVFNPSDPTWLAAHPPAVWPS